MTLVSGSIASGKTALLHAFAERATDSGARFLGATCSSAESGLSLGVVDQIFLSAKPEGDNRSITDGGSRALHRLCMAITARNDGPLVIGIDDIEYADPDSQQCILYLARRLTASPVMLVLTTSADLQPVGGPFQAELLRQPQTSAIRLAPLTPDGVARVLAEYLEPADADRLATACHGISGGNPLLVHALGEDHRASADQSAPLTVGDAFGRAFLNCLYRCDPVTLSVVRALAVLDGMGARLASLVDMEMEPERVDAILRSLHTAGLLYRGHFRHPLAHAAVLQSIEPQERQRLHTRAARILYGIGSPAITVADHLVAAKCVQDDWGVGVLKEAAEQRLSDGDVKSALDALNLAYRACTGEPDRVAVKSLMARAEWRINPSSARRHLPELTAAMQAGELAGRPAIDLIDRLLWHGRTEEAVKLLGRLSERAGDLGAESATVLRAIALAIAFSYPDTASRLPQDLMPGDDPDETASASPLSLRLRASVANAAILSRGPTDADIGRAEQILQVSRIDDTTVAPISVALMALFYADRADKAAAWCAPLLAEANHRGAPTWQAMLGGLQGTMAQRQGDLAAAEQHGHAALARLPARGWGVVIAIPLSLLILTKTQMGKHDAAAELLRHPVPEAMFRTPFGLQYLHARGLHLAATNRLNAALNDFHACGELMQKWGFDLPSVVPWRSEAAQVHLALGQMQEAQALVREQLALLGPGNTRARGITLRVLAAVTEPRQRPQLLRQAAEVLQACGDRLELARTLAALSRVKDELGRPGRARALERRAQDLAATCYAKALPATETPATETPSSADVGASSLSNAERRVAELAAKGYTNREIACELFVTVSTVEQHLTRVYRKLNVNCRADLPLDLDVDFSGLTFDDHAKAIA